MSNKGKDMIVERHDGEGCGNVKIAESVIDINKFISWSSPLLGDQASIYGVR